MLHIDEKNIRLGLIAEDRDDCIRKICAVMAGNGYVGGDYADAVIEREKMYPTGLPTEGTIVAIPHAAEGEVLRTGVGIAVLESPVGFYNIADPEELLMAEVVFVLANFEPGKQLDDLRSLMECLSEPEMLKGIRYAACASEIVEIFRSFEPE